MNNNREPRVYVIKENSKLNYLDAERFGDIVFITNKNYSPIKNSLCNKEIIQIIAEYMDQFDPGRDFLLLTGGPILIGYAFHLGIKKKGYISLLQWDNLCRGYIPVQFNIEKGE